MVTRLARWLFERAQRRLDKPWAMFEVVGFEADGRMAVNFDYNPAFISTIKSLGYHAETDEDTVQLFFYTSTMRPTQLEVGDEPVQSDAHPQLSHIQNEIRV